MWSLRLGAKPPLDWSSEHESRLCTSDRLWDDLRAVWVRAWLLEVAAEDATGDTDLLTARDVHRAAEARVDAAFAARRAARQRARSISVPDEIEREINDAISASRAARAVLIEHARRVRATIRPTLLAIWRARDAACREIAAGRDRRYPDLHWAQANDVLRRYETAAREAAKRGRIVRPAREHPSSSLYVQLMARSVGGVRVEREGRRAKIDGATLAGTTWGALTAAGRRASVRIERGWRSCERMTQAWGLLVMPLGGGIEVRLPVRLHREPPADALVKGVRIVRRGREWHAIVSIQSAPMTPIERGAGVLYAGTNWRRMADGSLRVLDGIDKRGVRVQVCLPPEHMAQVAYADALRSALDLRASEVVARRRDDPRLADALASRDWSALRSVLRNDEYEWVHGSVPVHRRHDALLALRRQCGGDAEKYASGAAEILGDAAGRREVDGLRAKIIRRRDDLYRRCARWLIERYGRVVLAEIDGSRLARVERSDGTRNALPLPARRQREAAAPFSLVSAIRWAAQRGGAEVVDVPAVDLSHTCTVCGSEMHRTRDDEASLILRCGEHGAWDRDHALSLALWRDAAPEDKERWEWHAALEQRSRAEIVRVDAEVERTLRGAHPPLSRVRYTSGVALATERGIRDGSRG